MKIRFTLIIIVMGVMLLSLLSIGCISRAGDKSVSTKNGVEIVILEKTPLLPHGTGDEVLKVAGRSFHNLYSADYLWISEWKAILFVTHREGSVYKLHIFSLETKHDIEIERDVPFGSDMGRLKTDKLTCFLEKVNGDVAVLVERAYKSPDIRYELDRANRTLRAVQ